MKFRIDIIDIDVLDGDIDEACHLSARFAHEVWVSAGAFVVEVGMCAKAPDSVGPQDSMEDVCFDEGVEDSVEGDAVALSEGV